MIVYKTCRKIPRRNHSELVSLDSRGGFHILYSGFSNGFLLLVIGLSSDLLDQILHTLNHGINIFLIVEILAGNPETAYIICESLCNENLSGMEFL